MLRTHLLLSLCGLLGFSALAAYAPPFAAGTERKAVTQYIPGKSAVSFQGSALALKFFSSGEPNWFSPDQKLRYGGMVVEVNGKAVSGVRSAPETNRVTYLYPNAPGLKQTLELQPDGSIRTILARPDGLAQCRWQLSLIGEFFGNSALQIAEKTFQLPPYQEKATYQKMLFDGSAQTVVFFADQPEKRITLTFASPVRMKLLSSGGRYGIWLTITPDPSSRMLEYRLIPGTVAAAGSNAPAEYLTKVGAYDFWTEDRLRLPDRGSRNLLSNSSFEQGFASLWFPHGGGVFSRNLWDTKPIAVDGDTAFTGGSSLRLLSDARERGLTQNIAVHPVILTPGTYTISFYAKSDRPDAQTLILDNLMLPPNANIWSEKNRDRRTFKPGAEWQRFSHTFKIAVTQPHYFAFSAQSQAPAVCRIDAMQLERSDAPTAYEPVSAEGRLTTVAADNFLAAGSRADAGLEITTDRPETAGTVETVVRDFFGAEVRREQHPFRTDQHGKARIKLNLESMPRGIFTVENRYRLADGRSRYEFTRFAVMDFLQNRHKHKNLFANAYIDPFGVRQFYPEVLDRYRKIGIGSRAAFANTEELVAKEAAKYGIDTLSTMLLRRDNSLARDIPKPSYGFTVLNNIVWYETLSTGFRRQDLATATLPLRSPDVLKEIENAAARRSGEAPWVQVWGAINEAEGELPEFANSRLATDARYRQYVELELAAARGLRRGNPNAKIGNSSTSNLRADRVETIDKLLTTVGDRFRYDCFIFHIYREAPEYPDLDADFQKMFAMLAKHGYQDAPVYCPEGMHWKPYRMPGLFHANWIDVPWGPLTYDMGHEERITAAWRARTWLVGLKNINRIKVMNSSTNFWGFEMDCALTPYANQKISNTLGRLLGDAAFVRDVRLSAKTRCYLFEDGEKRPVAALWSCDPEIDRGRKAGPELNFPAPPDAELFDLMEVRQPLGKSVRLSPFPVFLRGKKGATAALLAALEAAELGDDGEPAVNARFELNPPAGFRLSLTNNSKHTFSAQALLNGAGRNVTLRPGETASLPGVLPSELTAGRVAFESLRAELKQELPKKGNFTLREEFAGVLAERAQIRPNGSFPEWDALPALPITQSTVQSGVAAAKFSANLKIAWSSDKLFLLVDVTDEQLTVNPQTQLRNGWRNDSLQIFLDPFADGRQSAMPGLGSDDWSYGIYLEPGTFKPYVYRHHTPDIQLTAGFSGARPDTVATDVEAVFRRTAQGYRYELRFPVSALLPFKPAAGARIGVGVLLNNQNSAAQQPQSRLFWGLANEAPNTRPDLWPLVILTDRPGK